MSQPSFRSEPYHAQPAQEETKEPFSVRTASGRRVSILNPDLNSPPPIVDPRAIAGPSHSIVRITKTYRCSSCPKVFTSSGHLQRHGRVHSGEKQFTCPYPDCHKQCNRQDNLLQHYKIHLPRSERNRGPEYLNMAFAEMVAKQALLSGATASSRLTIEPRKNSSSPTTTFSLPASSISPVIESANTQGLHILAASALDSASAILVATADGTMEPIKLSTPFPHVNTMREY